jgi:uroporphyrinogen-III synthase
MGFDGLRVIAFESRRAVEFGELIRRQGGDPFVASSMREMPIEENPEAFDFAERLFSGEFDMVILLTGVGTRALDKVLATRYLDGQFAETLRRVTVVARGPKPVAALREMGVPVTIAVPEPNTWRELLAATADRPERRIAVQEYGKSNPELLAGLRERGAEVTPVRVYQWALPEDTAPLREAVHRLARGVVDVTIFTTSIQVAHLFQIAAQERVELRTVFDRIAVASIGPTTTESLQEFGITADLEPSHPKMGFLVKETAEQAAAILQRKRSTHAAP